ncbi:hypothetical protein [Bacillus changyiensis]|uniref:hypothetical protein n=1 Tax=Bacillus changyiensis TaxID=3004103 RepID=UPI0022E34B84|nr:hypothetical protein [Bacillus changyiensis]MDA1477608.1 hypothetical protein [Bacillus changyiensis]
MNKEAILIEVKKRLEETIKDLNFHNLSNIKEFTDQHFEFLEHLKCLPELVNQEKQIKNQNAIIENEKDFSKNHFQNVTDDDLLADLKHYVVKEWKLSGGAIALNQRSRSAFIPEKIVREKDIHLGDIVEITNKNPSGDKKHFKLIKKGDSDQFVDKRIVLQCCPVEIDDGKLVVTKDVYGNDIKIDDAPFTIVIQEQDRIKKNIEPGHSVDIAFYEGKAHEARVFWRHPLYS